MRISNGIRLNIDKNPVTLLTLLEDPKAFDMLNHEDVYKWER